MPAGHQKMMECRQNIYWRDQSVAAESSLMSGRSWKRWKIFVVLCQLNHFQGSILFANKFVNAGKHKKICKRFPRENFRSETSWGWTKQIVQTTTGSELRVIKDHGYLNCSITFWNIFPSKLPCDQSKAYDWCYSTPHISHPKRARAIHPANPKQNYPRSKKTWELREKTIWFFKISEEILRNLIELPSIALDHYTKSYYRSIILFSSPEITEPRSVL